MVRSIEIGSGPAGAVVVKRATGDQVPGLLEEAKRLEAAAHPGVVELLGCAETGDGWELRLAHGGRPVATAGPLPAPAVATLVAGVAATLADLHDAGIVHGRIDGTHVLIADRGRGVVCGLGAEPIGATPADDVAALGALLVTLLGDGAELEPIPERRWFGRRPWTGWERRSLLLLADQACAEPPSRRPTARRLAAAIADAVPSAHPPAVSSERPSRPRHAAASATTEATVGPQRLADPERADHRPRLASLGAAVAATVALGAVAVAVVRPDAPAIPASADAIDGDVPPPSIAPRPTDRPPTTTTTTTTVPSARVEGSTVVAGGRRYQVGQPGDLVVLGDWDCVGGATPALLRPSTGEVFVFPSWPTGDSITVPATTRVLGAASPDVEVRADGCARLVVRREDGTSVAVGADPTA